MQTEKVEFPAGTMQALIAHFQSLPAVQIAMALQQARPVQDAEPAPEEPAADA